MISICRILSRIPPRRLISLRYPLTWNTQIWPRTQDHSALMQLHCWSSQHYVICWHQKPRPRKIWKITTSLKIILKKYPHILKMSPSPNKLFLVCPKLKSKPKPKPNFFTYSVGTYVKKSIMTGWLVVSFFVLSLTPLDHFHICQF